MLRLKIGDKVFLEPIQNPISEHAKKRCWIEIFVKEIPKYPPDVAVLLTLFGMDEL